MLRFNILLLVTYLFFLTVNAQNDSTSRVEYTPEFQFKEGIYLNFEQVRRNSPLPKSRVITTGDYSDPDFFRRIGFSIMIFWVISRS
jgi:hypothetical protein